MGEPKMKNGQEQGHRERIMRHLQVMYARKTREKQVFMEELKEFRKRRDMQWLKDMVEEVGPRWYQALSVPQRSALDNLEFAIYQDILEGRPHRTFMIMKVLGLFPRPNRVVLLNCIYLGRNDPKEMIAQLYLSTYGYPIEGRRASYCLNARLMLSAILYLGFDDLIRLLQKRFSPDVPPPEPEPKPKPKPEPPLASPYLQKMVAALYEPHKYKRPPPPPLPNLDDLNDPYEEEPFIHEPPPPPPPPPPPKKRLPQSYCDRIAGIVGLEKNSSASIVTKKNFKFSSRRSRASRMEDAEGSVHKKVYGLGLGSGRKKVVKRKKPVAPSTGLLNAQYTINGVYTIHGKTLYVLGSICILPAQGDLVHGGYRYVDGRCITIHCGFRGWPPDEKPDPCDCDKIWHDTAFKYVQDHKCYCGHFYDYGNEGVFPPDELAYFTKPTRHAPMGFNFETIYDTDNKRLQIEKEFKKIWDTDSVLHVDDGVNKVKQEKKKKKRRSSKTCLGQNPRPEDYLKCALRLMRQVNIAARLPDLHLVPELKEWMRKRLYGALTKVDKLEFLRKSTVYWTMFTSLAAKDFGHVQPPKEPMYHGLNDWSQKQYLNDRFRHYTRNYRLMMYRSHAYVTNLFWRSMYQAELPDKKFREIYFSYLFGRVEDVHLIHPYNSKESEERKLILAKKRYICLPAGVETEH
ncbi:unnamed protein product [Chrysodeixis includens]|uniref:DUF4771 domain-containing protein n=1 Tax=Chrysodeixis includens TaxID=689277 RepID=A0A9P0BZ06_CHRIL|nr:unnamed protein product [Chrysodeixis includens]